MVTFCRALSKIVNFFVEIDFCPFLLNAVNETVYVPDVS
jgi:hypothetical protein